MFTRFALIAAVALGLVGVAVAQPAQAPAPKKHPYEVTPEAGAWCICVTCFFENFDSPSGRDFFPGELDRLLANSPARKRAIGLVSELRGERKYQLPAYMFNRGDDERKKEEDRVNAEREMRKQFYQKMGATEVPEKLYRKRLAHIQDQYVVLIGGYASQEAAHTDLERIRKFPEPSKEFMNRMQGGLEVSGQRTMADGGYLNPFKTAMIVPNPTGPKPQRETALDQAELSKGLIAMNASNPYNLLKYQGKYTLVVKKYEVPARVVGRDKKNDALNKLGAIDYDKMYDGIAKAAEGMAAIFRNPQLNFESYVLHTPNSSMVTVGIFDSESDPRLQQTQARLSKLKFDVRGGTDEQLVNPAMPIPVPKVTK